MNADNNKSMSQSDVLKSLGKSITKSDERNTTHRALPVDSKPKQKRSNNPSKIGNKTTSSKNVDETLNAQKIIGSLKTSKTLQANVSSTKTLASGQEFHLPEALPENQPPHVPVYAEGEKTERLQKLGKYYLLKEISRSPNGVVYKARHEDLHNRIVALKVMSNVDENPTGDRISRFKQEINYISSLQHPNIVPVYDIGTTESWLYFTMAFVEGCSLGEYIKTRSMSVNHAVRILIKVAKGIHYANQHGIIHRDIKPSNILLDKHTGEPLIVDFGLAKDIKSDVKITQSGVTLGTPPYMPPEQVRGKQELLDSRSDVYSLGATLYELITKRAPFEGETGMQIMMKVLNNSPSRPRKYNSSISPDLEAIIMKCLSKKQADRYQNSLSLATDLKKYLSGDWVTARQNTPINRVLTRIYSYRYMIYSILFALLAISVFVLSGYFRGEIEKIDVKSTMEITDSGFVGQENRRFKILGDFEDQNSTINDLWLHDEIWMNQTTSPFAQSFEKNKYAGLILSQPIGVTDFEVEFDMEILPYEDEFPNFSFFLVPDEDIPEVDPYSDPVLDKGYLLTFGADDNKHWVLYRNGIPQIGDSSFVLGEQNYSVRIQVNSGKFIIEVQDRFRQVFTLRFNDTYPLPLTLGGHFGFISINTPVVISSLKLSLISPAMSELEKPDRLFNLGEYKEAMIDYRQKALFAKARRNYELYYSARFKEILCDQIAEQLSPEEIAQRLTEFEDISNLDKPENYESVYLQNLYKLGEFQKFQDRFQRILNDTNTPAHVKQKLVYQCYHLASKVFANIHLYNTTLDNLMHKPTLLDFNIGNNEISSNFDENSFEIFLLMKRFFAENIEFPSEEMRFSSMILNTLVKSSIDDEYIKYCSKNIMFLAESMRNHSKLRSIFGMNNNNFVDAILRHYLSEIELSQCCGAQNLYNILIMFESCDSKNLGEKIAEIDKRIDGISVKHGFRLDFWLKKLKKFTAEILMKHKLTENTQTQPEKAEVR